VNAGVGEEFEPHEPGVAQLTKIDAGLYLGGFFTGGIDSTTATDDAWSLWLQ
jgi:hypothetical protein